MADTSISNLTATSPATAAHRIPIAITPFGSGNNGYITPALILSYGTSPITGTTVTATSAFSGPVGSASAVTFALGAANHGLYSISNAITLSYLGFPGLTLNNNIVQARSDGAYTFTNATSSVGTADTGLSRISAGVIGVGTGAAGSYAGTLQLEQLTVGNGASINHNANRLQFNSSTERAMQISNYSQAVSFFNTYMLAWASTGDANGTLDTSLSRISAGLVGLGTGAAASFAGRLKLTSTIVAATTVAALNASPTVGEISTVNDALAVTAKGATVAAGGAAVSVVVWNGANWVGI
jgi:hypothetical protein